MGRYSKVSRRVWIDKRFKNLSPLLPSGQAIWLFLLTCTENKNIPGLFEAREVALADKLGWPLEAFREAFREALNQGMAQADWKAGLVWLPKAIHHNRPESVNVVKSWVGTLDDLPECNLKDQAYQYLLGYLEGLGKAYLEAFAKPSRKPSRKPCGIQEQEQEQLQEQEQEQEFSRARTREETLTQNFLKSKKENPKPDQAIGDVPESILEAQRKLERARERLKTDRLHEREQIEIEPNREESTAIHDIIDSFSSNVYITTDKTDQFDENKRADNGSKQPLESDSSEIDWTIARDIFSTIRARYGFGSYKPTGYGKYSDSLSDVASWANAESGEWTARELVELSAAGFIVSANEKTKEAKFHPGFWWGDPGAHLQAGLNELKKWELEIVISKLTEAKFTKPKTDEVMQRIETLIKQRDRIRESISSNAYSTD